MIDLKEKLRDAAAPASDWRATVRDFLVALVVFGTLFGAVSIDRGNAFPMPPPPELGLAAGPNAPGGTEIAAPVSFKVQPPTIGDVPADDRQYLLVMLALAMASLAAFNTTVWRHFRRPDAETKS